MDLNLPPEAIAEFKQIFKQERGIELSDDEAQRLAYELLALGQTIVDISRTEDPRQSQNTTSPKSSLNNTSSK